MDGYPLTENGREQVLRLTGELRKIHIDSIVTSPMLRARQTAQIISSGLGIQVRLDPRLAEIGFGKFNNGPFINVPKMTYESHELEQWEDVEKRVIQAIYDYQGDVVFVSHMFPIRVAIAHFLGLDEDESLGIYSFANASISAIDVENSRVLAVGSPRVSDRLLRKIKEI
jgi:broad specificity phosphatase PhoE